MATFIFNKWNTMKEKHNYTVKTYFDTTDEERILRDSEDFFAN